MSGTRISRRAGPRSSYAAVCRLLEEDPDLAAGVPRDRRERATDECIATVVHVPRGRWSGHSPAVMAEGVGLLVLEGLLIRRVGLGEVFGAEVLGEGDLLRPWEGEDAHPTLHPTTGWRVLTPLCLAVLDDRAAHRLARYPELTGQLVGRAMERTRSLAVNMAIVHQPRVEVRLHMLFWHLAARWGRVTRDGTLVPLRLTHAVLADLVAARRPTVSSAMSDMARRGQIRQTDGAWLLRGGPPGELVDLQTAGLASRSGPRRS